jgi:PAS domain S-box-containing protein
MQGNPNDPRLGEAIRHEQIEALYHAPVIMLANPINAALLAAAVGSAYPSWIFLLWIGLFIIVVSVRLIGRAQYLQQSRRMEHDNLWARRFVFGAAATGFLWGLSGSIVMVSPDPIAHVLVTFVLGGMTVGAVFQEAAYLPAFFSFALPAVVPQVILYLAKGERVSIVMGLMLAAYMAVVALMGRYLNRWIVEAIRLRLEQAAVNAELRSAVAANSAVLNEIEQVYRYAPVGLCHMDKDYRFLRINEHMAEINGLTASAHIGRTLREVIPGLADRLMELYRPIYERGEPVLNAEIDGTAPTAPDARRHWLANFFPFRSEAGEVTGLIGAVMDTTDLKQAQSALQQSEERFRTIFNSVNDLIFVHDFETGAFVEVNQRACEMFNYTREEMLALKPGDLSENKPPYTGKDLLSRMQDARSGLPQVFDWRAQSEGWAPILG